MMDDNKFFKWVWRLNGLIILGVMGFFVLFLAYEFLGDMRDALKDEDVITNVADDPRGDEKWQLGYQQEIEGTHLVLIPLVSEKDFVEDVSFASGYSSSEAYHSPTKNMLFLDTETNNSHWLFKDNNQIVTIYQTLTEPGDKKGDVRAIAIYYEVVIKDTNGDGQLDRDDNRSIALSKPDGSEYRVVMQDIDKIIGRQLYKNRHLQIVTLENGVGYSSFVSLADFTMTQHKALPKVE